MEGQRNSGGAKAALLPDKKHVPLRMSSQPNPLKPAEVRFLCNVRFKNDLPEVSCDPKMLLPPLDREELSAFHLTSLEREMKRDMLFPPGLGISLTPLDIERFSLPDQPPPLDPKDAALLEGGDEPASAAVRSVAAGAGSTAHSRRRTAASEVSWLMRTKYMTAAGEGPRHAAAAPSRKDATSDDAELEELATREGQIAAIERSFEAAQAPPVHPKNAALTPLEVLPVLPDQLLEGWQSVLAVFDGDPVGDVESLAALSPAARQRAASASHLKSFVRRKGDGSVDRFVALMVPAAPPEHLPEHAGDTAGGGGAIAATAAALQGDYLWVREYDSQVRYDQRGQTYLLRLAGDHVAYSDLNTKVALRKRKRSGSGGGEGGEEEDGPFLQPEKFVLGLPGGQEEGMGEEGEAAAAGGGGGGGGLDTNCGVERTLQAAPVAVAGGGGARLADVQELQQQQQQQQQVGPASDPGEVQDMEMDGAAADAAADAQQAGGGGEGKSAADVMQDLFGSDDEDDL